MQVTMKLELPGRGLQIAALVSEPPYVLPPFHVRGHVALVDKNVLMRAQQSARHSCADDPSRIWLNQLNCPDVILNPILYAFEGRNRRVPSRQEYLDAFAQGLRMCGDLFPRAKVVHFPLDTQRDLYAVFGFVGTRRASEVEFLRWLAPLVACPVAKSKRWDMVAEILGKAVSLRLEAGSLVVLLALAMLFDRGGSASGKPIAGGVIKPSQKFNEESAHNALADIRALEILGSTGVIGGPPVALCTADRSMARLWRALQVSDQAYRDARFVASVAVSRDLFPLLDDSDRDLLLEMIGQCPRVLS